MIVIAVFAIYIYRGASKGAVGVLISAAAAIVAFIAAFTFSGVISEKVYGTFVKDRVEEFVDKNLENAIGGEMISGLSQVDMSKALIKDTYLKDMELDFGDGDKARLDLSSVDLTETGLQNADLTAFGIDGSFDYGNVRAGVVSVTENELDKYGLEDIVLARVISTNIASDNIETTFRDIGEKLSDTFSTGLQSFGKDLASGSADAVYTVVLTVISGADADYGGEIMDRIVTPTVMPPLKIIVFLVLFALVMLILNIIAGASKIINRIPVISSVNGVLGAVLGLAEGAIVLLIMCMVMKFVISVCGDQLVFINEPTVSKTYIFRFIYALDPFNLFGQAG